MILVEMQALCLIIELLSKKNKIACYARLPEELKQRQTLPLQ